MLENSFFKHFLKIGMGTFVSMFLGLITTPIITRIVSPDIYGKLSIFNMYVGIFVMILCLGLDQSLVRYFYVEDNLDYKRELLFKCIVFPILITEILSIIFFCLRINHMIKFEFSNQITILLCMQTLLQLIYRFSLLIVRLEYNSNLYSALTILSKILYVGLVLILLYNHKMDYFNCLVWATVLSTALCLFVSIIKQRSIWCLHKIRIPMIKMKFAELINYGWPFIISMGITQLFQALDKISLNKYCSYTDVGVYSSAMTLVNIFAIVQTSFNSLWGPMAIEHYETKREDTSFYKDANQYITIIMFFLGFSLIFVKDIFAFLLGTSYRDAAYILPFLIFNPIMYTISETTVQGIVFMKKTKMNIVIGAISCLVNYVGNSLLVPALGCKGAAISTGISYIVFGVLRTCISNHYFYIDFSLGRFAIITLVAILFAGYNTFFKFNYFTIILYIVSIIILIVLYKKYIKKGFIYLRRVF